jgi:hypothetical protein
MFTTAATRRRRPPTPFTLDESASPDPDPHGLPTEHSVFAATTAAPAPLHRQVDEALRSGDPSRLVSCRAVPPTDEADELLTLLSLQDLALAPLQRLGSRAAFHGHPSVADLQHRLQGTYLERLRRRSRSTRVGLPDGVSGVRRAAALERVPAVYRWLRDDADWDQMVAFLAVEGGPDAGFDDLVALAQIGIQGVPKVALAQNYWDEMGGGRPERVHTELHHRLVDAVDMPRLARDDLATPALDRTALNGVLATNRWLQPELIGALGVLELQAGPRCRAVVGGLERLGAGEGAIDFYREHADVDPVHGKDWLDRVVEPLSEDPSWARRMVDGAVWRHVVNHRFFAWWDGRLVGAGAGLA